MMGWNVMHITRACSFRCESIDNIRCLHTFNALFKVLHDIVTSSVRSRFLFSPLNLHFSLQLRERRTPFCVPLLHFCGQPSSLHFRVGKQNKAMY